MKVTRSRLLQIIKEEVEAALDSDLDGIPDQTDDAPAAPAQDTRSNRNAKIVFKRDFLAQHPDFKAMGARAEGDREVRLGPEEAGRAVSEVEIITMFDNMGYTVEQEILLQHHSELAAIVRKLHVGEVEAIHQHPPLLGPVERHNQAHQRTLAGAARPDQGGRGARLGG